MDTAAMIDWHKWCDNNKEGVTKEAILCSNKQVVLKVVDFVKFIAIWDLWSVCYVVPWDQLEIIFNRVLLNESLLGSVSIDRYCSSKILDVMGRGGNWQMLVMCTFEVLLPLLLVLFSVMYISSFSFFFLR